jgi:hypothetical protein
MDVSPAKSILSRFPKHAARAEANSDVALTIVVSGTSAFRSPLESWLLFRADQQVNGSATPVSDYGTEWTLKFRCRRRLLRPSPDLCPV